MGSSSFPYSSQHFLPYVPFPAPVHPYTRIAEEDSECNFIGLPSTPSLQNPLLAEMVALSNTAALLAGLRDQSKGESLIFV